MALCVMALTGTNEGSMWQCRTGEVRAAEDLAAGQRKEGAGGRARITRRATWCTQNGKGAAQVLQQRAVMATKQVDSTVEKSGGHDGWVVC